jgi:hypothetical protein
MKKLILLAVIATSSIGWAGTCGNSYSFSRQYLLQRAVGSDQTNYVYDMVLGDSRYATVANGGQVNNTAANSKSITGPADFILCDAASAGNPIKFSIPFYDATAGTVEVHFMYPTLHTASQDSMWVFANNAAVVTSQQDLSFYATAGITLDYHFPNGSSLSAVDFAGTNNGTINNGTSAVAGVFDGGAGFVGASSQSISAGLGTSATTNVSMEMWINYTGTTQFGILAWNGPGAGSNGYALAFTTPGCGGAGRSVNLVLGGKGCGFLSLSPLIGPRQHHLALTRDTTNFVGYYDGDSYGGTATVPNTPLTSLRLGSDQGPATFATIQMDEFRIWNTTLSQNYLYTEANIGHWATPFMLVEPGSPSYSVPTKRQFAACAQSAAGSCLVPFPLTSTGIVTVSIGQLDTDCNVGGEITSGLGLTYTLIDHADYPGTLHHYYTCLFAAPITSTGFESISTTATNISLLVQEWKGVTTSGVVHAQTNLGQPTSISVTSPANNSLLLCLSTSAGEAAGSTTPAYNLFIGRGVTRTATDHPANTYVADSTVTSGSQSCQFNVDSNFGSTNTTGGVLAVFPNSPVVAGTKRRMSQVY